MKQEEFFSIESLKSIIEKHQVQQALIFTGKRTFALYKDLVLPHLPCDFDKCDTFDANPKKDQADEAIAKYNPDKYQIIIAIGGGSAIDFAKLYKYFTQSSLPLVAIPTTAGTGSEVTQFAVYYEEGEKQALDDSCVLPTYSILDAKFLWHAPTYLKACSGIDAYCQAIESYWAVGATDESKQYAKQSILLAKEHIEDFVLSQNEASCQGMALSSNWAGKAINISRTTAAHALSYKFTSMYGIPHGHAVALSMADLFEANLHCDDESCQDERGADYVRNCMQELLDMLDISDFRAYWLTLMKNIQLSVDFNDFGIEDKDYLISSVDQNRLKNNPKILTKDLPNFWKE